MKNKVLAMLLALCMVMSLLPMTVFASTEGGGSQVEGGENQGGENQGGENQGGENQGGENQGGENQGGENQGDETPTACETCGCAITGEAGACTAEDCAHTTVELVKKNGCAKKAVCTNEQCEDYNTVVAKPHSHTVATECAAGKNNAALKSCDKTGDGGHESDCPFKCDFGDCDDDLGHDGPHNDETNCSGDDKCGVAAATEADIAKHKAGCTTLQAALEDEEDGITLTNKAVGVYEWTFTPDPVTCDCDEEGHDHEGSCTEELEAEEQTLSINVVYGTSDLDTEDEEAVAAAIKAAGEAATTQIEAAEAAAQEAWEAENEGWVCDACKAALTESCTMHADCGAEVHQKNCLHVCTMNSSCGNTVGVSSAHKVQYVVKQNGTVMGTYNVRADALDQFNQLYAVAKAAYDSAVETWEGITEEPTPEQQTAYNTAVTTWRNYELSVGAVHCPQAKVPDGTVVSIDEAGEVVAAPAETPEKPTKAEEFTDMEDWMAEGVQFALDNGLMEGLGNGKFDGRTKVDAITVATVFARMAGETITGASWKDDAKAWVENNAELFEGIDLEGGELARKDVVLVMWRQAGKPEPSADFELEFTDVEGLEGDHLTAMKWAVESGIVKGNGDGTANPDGGVSRGELCILLSRSASKSEK